MAEACATSVASKLVSTLVEYLIAPIGRQFGYVLGYKSYVEDLKKGVKDLKNASERVQHSVDKFYYDGKPIYTDVTDWLESVKKEAEEAENLLRDGDSAKDACFRGWLPNPLVRHPIGRKVKKMTQVIQELHKKSKFLEIHHENPPPGIVAATTSAARCADHNEDVLESRASIAEKVMKAIADDKVCVVGVYGPGGVGKSKLLEDVERQVKEEKLFDVVAKAQVSRTPNMKEIQGEIAYALGLKLTNDEPVRVRADRLCKRLKDDSKKKILIILDNLWKKLELNEVGIPCGYDNKVRGCKLLLTSRNREVLRTDMGSDREFRLNELEDGEARRLFERMVGDRVNNFDIKPWVDGVIKNCGGLPLLIVSLAKRLKHGDLAVWRNASTHIDVSDVKSIVELNYSDLEDERIRSLFLVCALESGRTSMRYSLIYGMGLGLYKEFSKTVENARDRLIMDLHTLQDSSLLLDTNDMERIRMHDIFVDGAISIAFTEWNALVGRKDYGFKEWSKDELRKCPAMCFRFVGIDELPGKLDCPNLRMLLLLDDNPSLKIPESFFESMEKLQVLDLSGLSLTSLPSSIEFLVNLKSLCLDFCHLEDVTILGKLKGLQFLSFVDSTIAQLPKEIGELTNLRYLDLRGCARLKVIEPGVLGNLVNLEELYIQDSFDQWEAEDEAPRTNASLAELNNMKKLSILHIAIPHSANLSRDLPFGKLNKYKIQVGDVGDVGDWSGNKESRTLLLKMDSGNPLLEEWVQRCLRRTQDFHLDGLQDGNDSIHDLCIGGFPELKHLHVQKSPSLQYIVHSTEDVQCTAFTRLESLSLENLINFEKICHGRIAPESFSQLKILKVDDCGDLKHLFPLSMTRIFVQLEEVQISRCHLMQQIVADPEREEKGDEIHGDLKVMSCNLRKLTLRNLSNIKSFYKTVDHSVIFFDGQQVSLPWLESLTLSKLPQLKEIWNSRFLTDVSNLKKLKVEDCNFLLRVIPSNLLIKLQNLEVMTIERCQLLRELFDLEGLTVSGDIKILSRLTRLILSDLPSLRGLWCKNPRRVLCFQNLTTLKVQNCDNLRFLFSASMVKELRQMKEMEISSCKLMEEIMDVQEEEFEEAAITDILEFPLLNSLSLEELPNLRAFSYGKYRIHCPSLTRLRISGCSKMMTFSSFEGKQQLMTTDIDLQQAFYHINSGTSLPIFFNQNVLFPSLEELTLLSLGELRRIWHNELPEESFCRLASITVGDCENLSHIFPSTLIERFQSLKMIEVFKCLSLEALMEYDAVHTKKRQKHLVLLDLKELKLWDLPRLNAVGTSSTRATLVLPNLTNVSLSCCHSLRYLFTNDTDRILDKLEMLHVSSCNNMQEVVAMKENEEQNLKAMKFSHLRTLKLCGLDSLTSFSSGSCAYEFPSLINLSILDCTKLKAFVMRPLALSVEMMNEGAADLDEDPYALFDEKVIFPKVEELRLTCIQSRKFWKNEMPDESICRLKVLEVKQCHNLLNLIPSCLWKSLLQCMESLIVEQCPHLGELFTMSTAKSLGQLQYLRIGGCGEMEYLVAREEEKFEEAAEVIVFPQLVTLSLHNMPKLRSFCHGKHILGLPSLNELTVEDCKAVKVIVADTDRRKLNGSTPMQEPLLLIEKVDSMKIWPDEHASKTFSKLKMISVDHCEKLLSIFSSDTILTRLRNLEKLTVTNCNSLEVVFHIQESTYTEARSTSTFQLRELNLKWLPEMKHVWSGHSRGTMTFGCLRCMVVIACKSLKSLFPNSVAKTMTQLEELMISESGVEEIIAEEDGGVGTSAGDLLFPRLTALLLIDLPKLRSFYKNSHPSRWPLLKELHVTHCDKLSSFSFACEMQSYLGTNSSENQPALFSIEKVFPQLEVLSLAREDVELMQQYIFGNLRGLALACHHDENDAFPTNFLLQRFPNLEVLYVSCSSFKEIFPEDAFGLREAIPYEGLTDMGKPLKALANLKLLRLHKLCNLWRVWKDGSLMTEILKQIEDLLIWECHSLFIVFPSPTSFQSLIELEVRDCAGLVHMGTSSAMSSLAHLTRLIIRDCGAMKDVVTDDGNEAEEISFPKLGELTLHGLLSLKSFSHTNCAFRFPSLVHIIVTQCPTLNVFCKGDLRTPKLDKVLLSNEDGEGRWMGDLNTTIQTLSTYNNLR